MAVTLADATRERDKAKTEGGANFLAAPPKATRPRREATPADRMEGESLEEMLAQLLGEAELETARRIAEEDAESDEAAELGRSATESDGPNSSSDDVATARSESSGAEPLGDDEETRVALEVRKTLFRSFKLTSLESLEAQTRVWGEIAASTRRRDLFDRVRGDSRLGICRLVNWDTGVHTTCEQGHGACELRLGARRAAGLTVSDIELTSVAWLVAGSTCSHDEHRTLGEHLEEHNRAAAGAGAPRGRT